MNFNEKTSIRVAILDLNNGAENQGMRCIREILNQYAEYNHLDLVTTEYDVRQALMLPGTDHDIYISSGGPGSPIESIGMEWDNKYMEWLATMDAYNNDADNNQKKYIFFICHSFQLASRFYQIGQLSSRRSTAFGVFPVHLLNAGVNEPVFEGMTDPFYAVDSRDFQLIQPDEQRLAELGARILCIEKERSHVPYERAVMGIRFTDYFIGTQFHPEADAVGMTMHLLTEDKKKTVIENHGFAKWQSMIEQLNDPDKILWTYAHVLPNFLNMAVNSLQQVHAA